MLVYLSRKNIFQNTENNRHVFQSQQICCTKKLYHSQLLKGMDLIN